MKILIIKNPESEVAKTVTDSIVEMFENRSITCVVDDRRPSEGEYDFAVTVGGDGTLLHAAYLLMGCGIPIVGVNVGRLGFLTALTAEDYHRLDLLLEGNYYQEDRITLVADCAGKRLIALNEFLFAGKSMGKTVDVSVYCDGSRVLDYRGDGVIISTPTGSTAYSLSAGGPIIDAQLSAITVTPLCAHGLGTPPMVFSGERTISVKLSSGTGPVKLCADGREEIDIVGDINIFRNDKTTPLVYFSKTGQFVAIDEKLRRK